MFLRKYTLLFLILFSYGIEGSFAAPLKALELKKGNIFSQQQDDKSWLTFKIIEVDTTPNGDKVIHCLYYNKTAKIPNLETISSLNIVIYHMPFAESSFSKELKFIAYLPPLEKEMIGFIEYLKRTDFNRYAEYTHQDIQTIFSEATTHYNAANELLNQEKMAEAIVLYSKAVDLLPFFQEALDNRGFTHMKLKQYDSALRDFMNSIQINPDNDRALFLAGDCLLKLGRYSEALKFFKSGALKFPEKKDIFNKFYNKAFKLNGNKEN